jgi:hypothetical protein
MESRGPVDPGAKPGWDCAWPPASHVLLLLSAWPGTTGSRCWLVTVSVPHCGETVDIVDAPSWIQEPVMLRSGEPACSCPDQTDQCPGSQPVSKPSQGMHKDESTQRKAPGSFSLLPGLGASPFPLASPPQNSHLVAPRSDLHPSCCWYWDHRALLLHLLGLECMVGFIPTLPLSTESCSHLWSTWRHFYHYGAMSPRSVIPV